MAQKGAAMLNPALKGKIQFNNISCLYEITENGVTYGMDFSEFQHFKDYFNRSGTMIKKDSIVNWYSQLDRFTKKSIAVSGNVISDDGFYPDE